MTFYINQLKSRLVTERNLEKLWNSFMNLTEREQFREAQRPCQDEELTKRIVDVAQTILRQLPIRGKVTITLFEVPGHGFVHGPMELPAGLGNLFYFTELDAGLLMIPAHPKQQVMARFSAGKMLPTTRADATVH